MVIDGSALHAGTNSLILNASAESTGTLVVKGGAGNDQFVMGANLTAADTITGGAGNDTLTLNGDYSSSLSLGGVSGIETITLAAGHSYNLVSSDVATVAAGATLRVDGSALSGSSMIFNGAAETNGVSILSAARALDTLTGGAGNDTFTMGANLTAADKLNGGAGNDTIYLSGDYSAGLTLGAGELQSIETVNLSDGYNYNPDPGRRRRALAGKTLTIDGSALERRQRRVDQRIGPARTTGSLTLIGGAGIDTLTGGAGNGQHLCQQRRRRHHHRWRRLNDTVVFSGRAYGNYDISSSGGSVYIFIILEMGSIVQKRPTWRMRNLPTRRSRSRARPHHRHGRATTA